MEEFIFLISANRVKLKEYSPQQLQDYLQQWLNWRDNLNIKSALISGESIDREGLRVSDYGETVTKLIDRPISSLVIIKASGMEEAVAIASVCPVFHSGGSLEIRRIFTLNF